MEQVFDVKALLSPPDIMQCKRALCIQPHPDDNEIGMGGIIAQMANKGIEVHYLTVTNGDQGNIDKNATLEETARTRHKEAQDSGKLLGAKYFHFFNYGDGTLSDVLELSMRMATLFREIKPDGIFCPDPWLPYEGHWDHIVVGQAASNAFHMSGRNHFPGNTSPWKAGVIGYYYTAKPNTVIDISDVFDLKFQSIALHKSQVDEQTLAMYRLFFTMKGTELAQDKDFSLGEGLKVLGELHTHCFPDAEKI